MPYVPYSPIPNKKTNDEQDLESESLRSLKSETYSKLETNHNYLAFFGTLICAIYFLYCALNATSNSEDWHFIDNVNLIFHEAGHPIFSFFGDFMHIAGGTLGQLLIPIICGFSFLCSKQYYSATVMLMWLGQNLTSISIYASDAIRMELPLLGGDTSGHDWHNMLEMTGLLSYTDAISKSIHGIGVIIVLSAIGAMLYIFLLKKQNSI